MEEIGFFALITEEYQQKSQFHVLPVLNDTHPHPRAGNTFQYASEPCTQQKMDGALKGGL